MRSLWRLLEMFFCIKNIEGVLKTINWMYSSKKKQGSQREKNGEKEAYAIWILKRKWNKVTKTCPFIHNQK